MHIAVKFSESQQRIPVRIKESNHRLDVGFSSFIGITTDADPYTGVFEATPSDAVQVFNTENKLMGKNFVVNPIPKEYGLVTYDQDKAITIT